MLKKLTLKSVIVLLALTVTNSLIAQSSCDTVRNYTVPSDNSYTTFLGDANGIILGHTSLSADVNYTIKSWGEPYEATTASNVRGVRILPHKVVNNSNSANLVVQVYQFDWGTAAPTTLLGSKTVSLNDLDGPMYWSTIMFDSPISVTGEYFVSYTFNRGTVNDTFALATTLLPTVYGATMFQTLGTGGTYNNVWHWVDEVYTSGGNPIVMAFALDVLIGTGTVPDPVITLAQPNICVGGAFSPNGTSSTGTVDSYNWYLTNTAITTIYNTATGVNPSITPGSNVPSSAALILEVNGACHSVYDFVPVTISSAVSATVTATESDCTNNGVITVSGVTGGVAAETATYRIGTGSFQSSNTFTGLAPGSYVVEVKKGGSGCTYTQTVSVGSTPVADASFSYASSTVCAGGSALTPTITTAGGTFTTTGALIIDAATGVVDVTDSPEGTYTITYTTAGACPNSSTQSLTITSAPSAEFTLSSNTVCSNGSNVTANVTGSVGVFSSTTGLNINGSTGEINVATSTPGSYVITNTIAASGSCPAVTHTETIEIQAAENASFTYSANEFCEDGTNPTITIAGTGGTFTSTSGLIINGATGELDIAASTVGTYIVTNTLAATGACPEVTATQTVVINANPTATTTVTGATISVNQTTGATYQWVDCADDSDIAGATSSTFAPSAPGSYKVVVTVGGCSTTSTCMSVDNVSVGSVAMDNVLVFPNPATDVLTVSGLTGNATLTVVDVNGKVIFTAQENNATAEISLVNVESGVYFITIASDKVNGTKRFIKK